MKRIFIHLNNFFQFGPDYLSKKLVRWSEWGKIYFRDKYMHLLRISQALPEGGEQINISDVNQQALKTYTFRSYPGRITLFRTDENSQEAQEAFVGVQFDPLLGWENLVTGGIDLYEIPSAHHNLLGEPYVQVLADKLKDCLQKAREAVQ